MTNIYGGKKSQTVILTGSKAGEIEKNIAHKLAVKCFIVENPDDLRDLNSAVFVVICPGNASELNSIYSGGFITDVFEEACVVVIASFPLNESSGRPVIFLRESDFAYEILVSLSSIISVSSMNTVFLNLLMWGRTGVLLPFFIHNMNNMLARIMGNLELAEYYISSEDKLKEKISVALEGSIDLRNFLERLSTYTTIDLDSDDLWTPGSEVEVLELGHMSSGTSVEFTHTENGSIPKKLNIKNRTLNSLLGILSSSATLSVNGCGAVHLESSGIRDVVSFMIEWTSSSKESGLCPKNMLSAADLLSAAAVLASHAGVFFRLDEWDTNGGSVSIAIPVHEDNAAY